MTTSRMRSLATLTAAAAVVLLANTPASADDTELFVGAAVAAAPSRPNILFVMDTSGSMDTNVTTQVSFNPADTYSGSCRADRVYWSKDNRPPSCGTDQYVAATAFTCSAAQPNLTSSGISYVAKAARWRSSRNRWDALSSGDNTSWIECQADAGIHGQTDASTKKYAADGSTNGPWSSNTANKIDWSRGEPITFYSGNYLNWRSSSTITRTRLEIMQEVLTTLLTNLDDNVNVGLMRYSNDTGNDNDAAAQGGMVVKEMGRIEDNREAMKDEIDSWNAAGWTPLSETLYEATQYYRGDKVYFGGGADQSLFPGAYNLVNANYGKSDKFTSTPNGDTPSVTASRNASDRSLYDSPADQDCQKNYLVFLTDGLPTQDNEANARIEALPDFARINGRATCDGTECNGKCTDDLSKWLHEADLRADRPGVQNVTSYWIGFGDDVASGTAFLEKVAQRGGGKYYSAADSAELTEAFSEIISKILEQTTTFTSPTVAVNAFNRTQNLNYLYMSVFKPATSYRWLGNIKKYRVTQDGEIRDVNDNAAVDPNNGFFENGSQSYWSDMPDGADAEMGGAAGELKNPTTRKIYSNLTASSGTLTEDLSALKDAGNLTLANLLLLGVVSNVAVSGRPAVGDLVDWAYGHDVQDENGNNDSTEARKDMGDPLHSRPATVIYGGPADDPDLTLYATTNDGYLQAINAQTGEELWAFVPRVMLDRIEELYTNDDVTSRVYGLDGAVRVVRLDRDGDGTIEPAGSDINGDGTTSESEKDKVFLYFGMRRGGSYYFGLDVTVRTTPKLLWVLGPSRLAGRRPDLVHTHGRAGQRQPHVDQQQPRQDGARVWRRLRRRPGHRRLRAGQRRQPCLHGGRRHRQPDLARGPDGGHRRAVAARQDDEFHPRRHSRDRPVGRRFRRPHVCRGHGRARLALRHPQRPGGSQPRLGRGLCLARQRRPHGQVRCNDESPLLLRPGCLADEDWHDQLHQRRHRLGTPRKADHGRDGGQPVLQPARLQRVLAGAEHPVQGHLRHHGDLTVPPDHHRR